MKYNSVTINRPWPLRLMKFIRLGETLLNFTKIKFMNTASVTLAFFVFFANAVPAAELQTGTKFLDSNQTLTFSAVEAKSYSSSNAYSFSLSCGSGECTLTRIFFSECRDAEDKNGEVMGVSSDFYTTKGKTLQVEILTPRSLSIKFSAIDMPYKKNFRISVSYDKDLDDWTHKLTSLSGVVVQTPPSGTRTEKVLELRRARNNEERLKRGCPIGLTSY